MANDLNLFQCIGRLGKPPEERFLTNGDAVVDFSLAVGWKGKDKEGVEWVNCVAFGKLAEIITRFCDKGKQIYVSGKLRTRKWQDKSGQDKYTTEVVCDTMQLLSANSDKQDSRAPEPAQKQGHGNQGTPQPHHTDTGGGGYVDPPFNPYDDIPFLFPYEYRELK